MYKVIELGHTFESTGEPRVRRLDTALTKTASSEIQRFWDTIPNDPNYAYLWVIGVSAMEYYGCNNNGDAFAEAELKKTHADFVSHAHVFLHHVNKDPAKSIGKPVYSWYNDTMHRVELVLRIDKRTQGADNIVKKIEDGEQLYVSMGCTVAYDVCSICGNKAPTRREYCDHLRYNMKKILPNGKQVYALNPNPKFFDISVVNKPADPTAFALDKKASEYGLEDYELPVRLSADLGEDAALFNEKIAALDKLSDMIKQISGTVKDTKSGANSEQSGEFSAIRRIRERGFKDMEYPDIPVKSLRIMRVSPGGLLRVLQESGAPLCFGDALYMSGRHAFGDAFCEGHIPAIMRVLPMALSLLRRSPENMEDIIRDVLSDYDGEMEHPQHRQMVIRILKPALEMRISVFSKVAAERPYQVEKDWLGAVQNMYSTKGSNFAPIKLSDGTKTAPFFVHQHIMNNSAGPSKIIGAALGTAAIASALSSRSLLEKIVYGTVLGVAAKNLLFGSTKPARVEHSVDGKEIKAKTLNQIWKTNEKTAGVRPLTAIGMAAPLAVALDYSYNDWKYRDDPQAKYELDNSTQGRVSEFTRNNPLTAVAVGGALGALLSAPFRGRK